MSLAWPLVAAVELTVERSVFVPAVMGAGLVFSIATILRDVFSLSSRAATARRSRIRGRLVADGVVRPDRSGLREAVGLAPRPAIAIIGLIAAAFSVYVAIGTTANFLRPGGYVSDIAWLWGASLVVVVASAYVAVACLLVAGRSVGISTWAWPVLLATPMVDRRDGTGEDAARWAVVVGVTLATALTILATWPHVLEPLDSRLADMIDEDRWIARLDTPGRIAGSTRASVIVALMIGLATLRCRRFAWVFVGCVAVSLAITNVLRVVVDRPRPDWGARAGITDSFPSGHMVQATLLAILLPLALHELTRSSRARRIATILLLVAVAVVALVAISTGRHHPSDVVAGVAIGVVVGGWARLTLLPPEGHSECRQCVFGDRSDGAR